MYSVQVEEGMWKVYLGILSMLYHYGLCREKSTVFKWKHYSVIREKRKKKGFLKVFFPALETLFTKLCPSNIYNLKKMTNIQR